MHHRNIVLSILAPLGVAFFAACSTGSGTTPDGGKVYTGLPPENIPCTTDTDCCVVTDGCRSAAYVVHAGDTVQRPDLGGMCNGCIVPAIQVWCKNGTCQSGELKNLDYSATAPFRIDHCGTLPIPADAGDASLYGEDGGLTTMAAYGCMP